MPALRVLLAVLASAGVLTVSPRSASTPEGAPSISDARLLGQRIMVGFSGTSPTRGLLSAVRRGEVGGVILFAYNIETSAQVRSLAAALQQAASQGDSPPLLIATDQEGGQVKRFPGGPPTLSPPQMGARDSTSLAYRQGLATGQYLRTRGLNMDLAPVLDVPTSTHAFIWQQGRAFSLDAARVAQIAAAFARGLQAAHVSATGKHFPGLGSAAVSTDSRRQELTPTPGQRKRALAPYRELISGGLDAVMLSVAGYPAYDRSGTPAALSAQIIQGLLRRRLGFRGVTLTDSLSAPTGHDEITAGTIAAAAGADMLLYTDSAPGELAALERALRKGRISRSAALASYQRIVALKHRLAG